MKKSSSRSIHSLVVEWLPSKESTRVRFPLNASYSFLIHVPCCKIEYSIICKRKVVHHAEKKLWRNIIPVPPHPIVLSFAEEKQEKVMIYISRSDFNFAPVRWVRVRLTYKKMSSARMWRLFLFQTEHAAPVFNGTGPPSCSIHSLVVEWHQKVDMGLIPVEYMFFTILGMRLYH